jgi:hypothetical protein
MFVNGGIAPSLPDLGTRWSLIVSFTVRQLYPWGKFPVPNGQEAGYTPQAGLGIAEKRNITFWN